ncbi:MAG: sensor histidine kinase [Desulfocucumaceae bacterium]
MFIWLIGIKIILYSWVFIKALQNNPISFPLVAIALALLVSGFLRNFYKYTRSKVNIITLLLDLILAVLFSLLSNDGSKLFMIYLTEGTAVLPKPFFIAYAVLATAASVGSYALCELMESGQMQMPGIAEIMLYVFVFVLVISERRQREQRLAYEKLTKELKYVNLQLQESTALSESLASEAERRRISGEIHDSLGHNLTGLILALEAGKRLASRDPEAGKTYWDKALQISRMALNSVRELVSAKKESNFEFELTSRLTEMVREVQALTGLQIDLDIKTRDIGLSGKEQFNMYRIFQEAITNTLRHANAGRAQISISGNRELLYFSYWDNGSGTNRIEAGNGLKGMNDRISDIGGAIHFQSWAGSGFQIEGCIDRRGKEQ